jgi:DUF971 family protein
MWDPDNKPPDYSSMIRKLVKKSGGYQTGQIRGAKPRFCYYSGFGFNICHPMSGLTTNTPRPTDIRLHQASRQLEIVFDDGNRFVLPCEFLRVYSPSAEVRGHGPGQEVLQTGKEEANIVGIEPVGLYAIKLTFSDGHDTGLYSWDYLYDLGMNHADLWQTYLDRLAEAGITRKENA